MQKLLNTKFYIGVAGMMFAAFLNVPTAHADTCGVNLFNHQLLTEADFAKDGNTYKDGRWNGYLNDYVSNYPFGLWQIKHIRLFIQLIVMIQMLVEEHWHLKCKIIRPRV